MTSTVLLGDPSFFRIKAGRNCYTRDRWGFRKRVDLKKAKSQWLTFKETLESLGARVHVLPGHPEFPGMVFPANAGFLHPKYAAVPAGQKRFVLSNLVPHRAGEAAIYKSFLEGLGFRAGTVPYLFEGEADFFPAGDAYLFCYGDITRPGFVPRPGFPPWRYRFSHRSDRRNLEALKKIVAPSKIIEVRMSDPRYYHGDTCLFAFGPKREHLFAYLEALDEPSRGRLKNHFGEKLIPLSQKDAENFVANSFQLDTPHGPHLVLPMHVSNDVLGWANSLGIAHTQVDVSEFFEKGGGSIKCLLCDLGPTE